MKRLVFGSVLLLASCVPPVVQMNAQFNPADYAPYGKPGTSKITGQAFLKTRGGDVKFGAGCQVDLEPATPYQEERLRRSTIMGENLPPMDPRIDPYTKTTVADGMGNFEFDNLPPGKYIAYCQIRWQVPNGYIMSWTGGMAYGVVKVGPGETKKVVVTY